VSGCEIFPQKKEKKKEKEKEIVDRRVSGRLFLPSSYENAPSLPPPTAPEISKPMRHYLSLDSSHLKIEDLNKKIQVFT
jgi:hypothetical protein